MAEWLAAKKVSGTSDPNPAPAASSATVNELVLAFWRHAEKRYVKNGQPTSEIRSFRTALRPVCQLYGSQPVTAFGPLALVACRQKLVEADICRKRINQHVGRIRHVFKWGVAREAVPESVWRALCAVEGLRRGEARETPPVKPVPEEHIAAVEPLLSPHVRAMVRFQLWTGCRPDEVCRLRTGDINMQGTVWEYRPESHKVQHHGLERVVYIGPQAQAILRPWLRENPQEYVFQPREARRWFDRMRAENRQSPRTPSQQQRKRKTSPKKRPGNRYTTNAYDHAIARACERASVPPWAPNRLRHNAGTRIRSAHGIEAAWIILGHESAVTSEIYAEADREKARGIVERLG